MKNLKPIIKNQEIRIDNHKRGTNTISRYDDPSNDIHIDKRTTRKINGKECKITIKVPLNSDLEIEINEMPRALKKEIEGVLKDPNRFKQFVDEIMSQLDILQNGDNGYFSKRKPSPFYLGNDEIYDRVFEKIAKVFGLRHKLRSSYTSNYAAQIFEDRYNRAYYFIVSESEFLAGELMLSEYCSCDLDQYIYRKLHKL